MGLPAGDQKLIKNILALGHQLEARWPHDGLNLGSQDASLSLLTELEALKNLIQNAQTADSSDLRRLAGSAAHLTSEMTCKHLGGFLIPFERLLGRSVRDDEFLVAENDRTDHDLKSGPLVVVAENIRSAFNVGALFRTAECFAAQELILTGYTSTPDDDKTARTSMGTDSYVPWKSVRHTDEALRSLKTQGYTLIALETVKESKEIGSFQWPKKPALIVGNERFGLSHSTIASADIHLRIPLHGRKNSLNVGIAAGIAMADWRRHYDQAQRELASPASALKPIGVFHSQAQHPYEARRQGAVDGSGQVGWIELNSGLQLEQALEDLDGFSHIWLIYDFHHNRHWKPKVMPPRGPRVKRGVFSTRSPYRPNPLGLSCVELIEIRKLKVFVKGFDLLDGTPVYDIKPYLPYADSFPLAKTGWLEEIESERYRLYFDPHVLEQLTWLEARGVSQIRGFLKTQAQFNPLDGERKRVIRTENQFEEKPVYTLSYRTWRAHFVCDVEAQEVHFIDITSGYTNEEAADDHDPYLDKDLHRSYLKEFMPPSRLFDQLV